MFEYFNVGAVMHQEISDENTVGVRDTGPRRFSYLSPYIFVILLIFASLTLTIMLSKLRSNIKPNGRIFV